VWVSGTRFLAAGGLR